MKIKILTKIISFKFNRHFCSKNIKSNINLLKSNKANVAITKTI